MRWYWIDRLLEFHSGRYARAVKVVSLVDDHMHDHVPGYPVMPSTLVMEGLAQTAGMLLCEHAHFAQNVVLAKISRAEFFGEALPGDTLTYTATIISLTDEGAMVHATSHKGDQLQAEADFMLVYLDHAGPGQRAFDPKAFLEMMRALGGFEVGRAADGAPLVDPL